MTEDEKRFNDDVLFQEDEILLARNMIDSLRTTMEFLYYLMDYKDKPSFTIIMISTDKLKLETVLSKWKRSTDILLNIDPKKNIYAIVCQATTSGGGRQFAKILLSNIHLHGGINTYCTAMEIKTTRYTIQDVVFKLVDKYLSVKDKKQSNEIFFTKLELDSDDYRQDIIYNHQK